MKHCVDCKTEKSDNEFPCTRSNRRQSRCRNCQKTKERARHALLTATQELLHPCGFENCNDMFTTVSGAGSHRRLAHGVRGKRNKSDGASLAKLVENRNVDSAGIWERLMATWPRKREREVLTSSAGEANA